MRQLQGFIRKYAPYLVCFLVGFMLAMGIFSSDAQTLSSRRMRLFGSGETPQEKAGDLPPAAIPFQPRDPNWKPEMASGERNHVPYELKTPTSTVPVQPSAPAFPPTTTPPYPETFGPPARLCEGKYGKFGIFMIYTNPDAYIHATNLMKCYATSRNYQVIIVQPYTDELSKKHCDKYKGVFFRKHCVASVYLQKFDWMLVTDADSAIINSDHCIEDYVEPRAEVIHYERYFTSEIAAGNYIVRNSPGAIKYLVDWADYEFKELPPPIFTGADNGFIHLLLLKYVYPEDKDLYNRCAELQKKGIWPDYEPGYGEFVGCCKQALRAFDPKKHKPLVNIVIYARGQAWVRDTVFQDQKWWSGDFMAHGIKTAGPFLLQQLEKISGFAKGHIPEECKRPNWRPLFTEEKHKKPVSEEEMTKMICGGAVGMQIGKMKPIYGTQNMSSCWPKCPWVLPLSDNPTNVFTIKP